MLLINEIYKSISEINNINESKDSDKFEQKCARWLRKQFPGHKFSVKGGSSKFVSDILVDDKFYIECKMSENAKTGKHDGSQASGFTLQLLDEDGKKSFTVKEQIKENKYTSEIIDYLNANFEEYSKFDAPNTKNLDLSLDKKVLAKWVSEHYKKKGAEFFITAKDSQFSIFKNTPQKILKYFDIHATVRHYKTGTKDLQPDKRDSVLSELNKLYKINSVKYKDKQMLVTIKDNIESQYIDLSECKIYLSNKNQKPCVYRIMYLHNTGAPRVTFHINTISDQDEKDIEAFKNF